jgi:hypothetical protein
MFLIHVTANREPRFYASLKKQLCYITWLGVSSCLENLGLDSAPGRCLCTVSVLVLLLSLQMQTLLWLLVGYNYVSFIFVALHYAQKSMCILTFG